MCADEQMPTLKKIEKLVAQIEWRDGSIPVPPSGWRIVLVDPGETGFDEFPNGTCVPFGNGEVGYTWGDTQSLLVEVAS